MPRSNIFCSVKPRVAQGRTSYRKYGLGHEVTVVGAEFIDQVECQTLFVHANRPVTASIQQFCRQHTVALSRVRQNNDLLPMPTETDVHPPGKNRSESSWRNSGNARSKAASSLSRLDEISNCLMVSRSRNRGGSFTGVISSDFYYGDKASDKSLPTRLRSGIALEMEADGSRINMTRSAKKRMRRLTCTVTTRSLRVLQDLLRFCRRQTASRLETIPRSSPRRGSSWSCAAIRHVSKVASSFQAAGPSNFTKFARS